MPLVQSMNSQWQENVESLAGLSSLTCKFTVPLVQCQLYLLQFFFNHYPSGVTKGSMIVALADVGAAMERPLVYQSRFVYSAEEGGVVADRIVEGTMKMAGERGRGRIEALRVKKDR
eukprot:1145328-Pelagomonas_calceolata.AAC.3